MSTTAQLFIAPLPDIGEGARRYTIDCPCSRTHTDAPPEPVAQLGNAALSRITLTRHDLECQCCDTSGLWARLRDAPVTVEEARHIGAQLRQAHAHARRN